MSKIVHYPVMVNNVLKKVEKIVTDKHRITIADCTFGFGGHSHRILQQFKNAKM